MPENVYLQSHGHIHTDQAKLTKGVVVELPYPTDDTRLMTRAACEAMGQLFRLGYRYTKAEVLLMDLCQRGEYADDLFAASQPAASERVMSVLDAINGKWERGTLRTASASFAPDYGMRRELMSRR